MGATQCSDASHPKEHVRAIGVSSARRSVAPPEVPRLIRAGDRGLRSCCLVCSLRARRDTGGSHRAPARRLGSRPRQSQYCQPVAGARGRDFAVEWRSGECVRKERGCQMDRSREDIRRPSGIRCCGLLTGSVFPRAERQPLGDPVANLMSTRPRAASACPISAEGITSAPHRLSP